MSPKSLLRKKLLRKSSSSSIVGAFIEEFEDTFMDENPNWEKIRMIFHWLREEAMCAMSFADINALNKCRRLAESHFSKLTYIRKRVWKESRVVNRQLMKRFEELRTTRKSTKGKVSLFEGLREEEKVLPPE